MKKMFAAAAMLLSVSMTQVSCKGGASEVGKWEVVDMTSPDMPADKAAETKAQLAQMHMTWEFTKDGKVAMSAMGMPASGTQGTYTRSGNTMELSDPTTKEKMKMEITTIDNEQMVLKGNNDGKDMTMTMKRAK